jgi:CelD/BcsL family acetyltransferase involved in cellulose biosynthesis
MTVTGAEWPGPYIAPVGEDVVQLAALSADDLDCWRALSAAAISPNPFAHPDFVLPAARGLGVEDVAVLVVRDGTRWSAALPVRPVASWRGVPGRCLAVWRHRYCFLGTPLVAGPDPVEALTDLFARGLRTGPCLALDWIDAAGPLSEPLTRALAAAGRPVELEVFERPALHRRELAERLDSGLSAHHRRELARKLRRLEAELGAVGLIDRSGDPAAYREFLALEHSGWKGANGTALACDSSHAAFFMELCERFAAAGQLQLLSLQSEQGVVVAMMCNLLLSGVAFGFKIAFDERLARFSPGMQLQLAYIELFRAGGWSWTDSCTERDNGAINRLWPGRRVLRDAVAVPRELAAAPLYAKWRAAAAALQLRERLKTVSAV